MADENEVKEQLDTLIKGVTNLNAKHTEFKDSSDTATAKTTEEIEALKKQITDTAESMQKQRQEDAALIAKQKEDFELLQKEIVANGGNSDEGLKTAMKDYDDHFARFLKQGTPIPEDDMNRIYADIAQKSMFGVDPSRIEREAKDLVAGSNADGGFFLTTDRSSSMSTRIFETSPIRPLANVQTTTSDVWEIILDDDEPDSGWVGEVSDRDDTNTAQIGLIKIPIHELYAQPRATQKMIDDAGFDIAAWHQGKVTRRFARDENTAFVSGDGSQKPKGFLSYSDRTDADTYQRDTVEQYDTSTASVIVADDLINLQGRLIEDYQMGAQWAMNRQTFYSDILTLVDEEGQYLINPRLIAEGGTLIMLGKAINLFSDMPVVADSALSIAYADWREFYTIVDRMGIRVLRDPYTAKPYVKYYTTKRVGGAVTNYEAGKLLKITAA
jgi:HK97 family phage major capsid protein